MAKTAAKRYAVSLTPSAERDLKGVKDRAVRRRLGAAIDSLATNPRPPNVEQLSGANLRAYRIRVGDYRILYTIDDKEVTVTVVRVGHRREVYR